MPGRVLPKGQAACSVGTLSTAGSAWLLTSNQRFVAFAVGAGSLQLNGAYLVRQAALEARILGGNVRGLLQAARHDEPVAADDFLGLGERTVRDSRAGNKLGPCGQAVAAFERALGDELLEPRLEAIYRGFNLFLRLLWIPLSAREQQVFGGG